MFGLFGSSISKTWRKKATADCPVCGSDGGGHQLHRDCRKKGKLWIDIADGTVHCDGCKDAWSLENTMSYCDCGAKYSGGEIWQGMAAELGQLGDLRWLTVLGVRKGTPRVAFQGWHTCKFCRKKEGASGIGRIVNLRSGGMCERCVRWCVGKWEQPIYISPSASQKGCLYCGREKRFLKRMIGNGVISSDAVICGECIQAAASEL